MTPKAMRLKGKIKNYAKKNNIAAQVVLQNYMFERFLERLSLSSYREKFPYAKDISYENIMSVLKDMIDYIK